jgi:hypothetical protein
VTKPGEHSLSSQKQTKPAARFRPTLFQLPDLPNCCKSSAKLYNSSGMIAAQFLNGVFDDG